MVNVSNSVVSGIESPVPCFELDGVTAVAWRSTLTIITAAAFFLRVFWPIVNSRRANEHSSR